MKYLLFTLSLCIIFAGCTRSTETPVFQHEVEGPNMPWSETDFDVASDKFTFAIITDLTGGEREGVFNTAVQQINLLRPEFVMSVGDLIEGGTKDIKQLKKEWTDFDKRSSKLKAPLFRVGGNHDLTNVEMKKVWNNRYGPSYYHFLYKDVLFLVLDSEDFEKDQLEEINIARKEAMAIIRGEKEGLFEETKYASMEESKTGQIRSEQVGYFKDVLKRHPNVRWTFLFMHKPVWLKEGDGNLSELEHALGTRPYTVFNGHNHSFSFTKRNGRDYSILGTTGGFQNPDDPNAFDHISLITMTSDGPNVVHLKMDGILDKTGAIPSGD